MSEEKVTKTIVCLANSRKTSGRCVAGKEYLDGSPGGWIRPIGERFTELSEDERRYPNGDDPQVLDVIRIPVKERVVNQSFPFQTENFTIDPGCNWEKAGSLSWSELDKWTDDPDTLWTNSSSTLHGLNDRIPAIESSKLDGSLYFLRLDSVTVRVFAPGAEHGNMKRRIQVCFKHRNSNYRMWTSDPRAESWYFRGEDGDYAIGSAYATISLAEPHDGYCYKVVATLLPDEWRK